MNKLEKYSRIERCFFDIDDKHKLAHISLHFDKTTDMFDTGYVSNIPMFSEEFFNKLKKAFAVIPKNMVSS